MICVFECATLADAVSRAARIAPTKGAAWDKAAGIVMDHTAGADTFVIRATDLEAQFTQRVAVLESNADADACWRLPSAVLDGVLRGLPMHNGATVTFDDDELDGSIKIASGDAKAKLRPIMGTFPLFEPFDDSQLEAVPDLAARLKQVAWCVNPDELAPLSGVHLSGTHLIACDRRRLVKVPCAIPVAKPITAPLSTLLDLIQKAEEVKLGAQERRLMLSPDRDTQATTTIFVDEYPDLSRIQRDDYGFTVRLQVSTLEGIVSRMLVLAKGDRYPTIKFGFMKDSIGFVMQDPDAGRMEDRLEVEGGPDALLVMGFVPQHLMGAITGAGTDFIELSVGPDALQNVRVAAGDYQAWVIPKDLTPRAA